MSQEKKISRELSVSKQNSKLKENDLIKKDSNIQNLKITPNNNLITLEQAKSQEVEV